MLFAVLVGGVGYFAYRRLWPLCVRAINPVYAAQTIEQASPSLKNSLINLLLFRQQPSGDLRCRVSNARRAGGPTAHARAASIRRSTERC